MKKAYVHTAFAAALVVALSTLAATCDPISKYVGKITVVPSEDLETVKITLRFTPKIKLKSDAHVSLKEYGYLFAHSKTNQAPAEVGLMLNTAVAQDLDYVSLKPTTTYPNGLPLPIPHPVVAVRGAEPIAPSFDLVGYVDVAHQHWLGVAMMIELMDDLPIPDGWTVHQSFAKSSKTGEATIIASVFGPEYNEDGTFKRQPGIAILVDVRTLIEEGKIHPGQASEFESNELITP